MAVFNDVLTTEGQRFLMKMLSGETQNIQFTKLVLGDGNTSVDLKTITAPVHAVAEVAIESVLLSAQNDVTITAVFRNTDITEGFYMREKAIYASDGTNEVLVLYANAGSLAEYIEPSTSEVYEKILRSILVFSQSDNVNITVDDAGYTNIIDFNAHLEAYNNPHKVTKEQVGLGNIENKEINDQTPTYTESSNLVELSSGDTLSVTLGKIARAIKDFISHIGLVASSSILGHIKIGTGLTMSSGTASVKLTDSVSTSDSTTAFSATGAKSLNDSKAPNSHASSATTYGTGNTSNYGHVKLSDNYTSNGGAASAGVGASAKAVYDTYNALNTNLLKIIPMEISTGNLAPGDNEVTLTYPANTTVLGVVVNGYQPSASWDTKLLVKHIAFSTNICTVYVDGSRTQSYALRYNVFYR